MNAQKQNALEAAGWRFGDAADFLGMTDAERQLLDVRIAAARAVRRQRLALKLSQAGLAKRIQTSQPRIAKIEQAASDVSLDQILRAFAAVGGRIAVKQADATTASPRRRDSPNAAKPGAAPPAPAIQIELAGTEA